MLLRVGARTVGKFIFSGNKQERNGLLSAGGDFEADVALIGRGEKLEHIREKRGTRKKDAAVRMAAALDDLGTEFCLVDDANGFFDVEVRLVDVLQRTVTQALREAVVLFLGNVVVGLVEQFEGAVETAPPIHVGIDGRMVVYVLAVIDGRSLDFANGFVDFVNGVLFLLAQRAAIWTFEVRSGVTQIGESMQIGRMLRDRRRLCSGIDGS